MHSHIYTNTPQYTHIPQHAHTPQYTHSTIHISQQYIPHTSTHYNTYRHTIPPHIDIHHKTHIHTKIHPPLHTHTHFLCLYNLQWVFGLFMYPGCHINKSWFWNENVSNCGVGFIALILYSEQHQCLYTASPWLCQLRCLLTHVSANFTKVKWAWLPDFFTSWRMLFQEKIHCTSCSSFIALL